MKNLMHLRSKPLELISEAWPYLTEISRKEPWRLVKCKVVWDRFKKKYLAYDDDGVLLAEMRVSQIPVVKRVASKHYGRAKWTHVYLGKLEYGKPQIPR